MKKVEIGFYKTSKEYFAWGISGYKMEEIKEEDKYLLAFQIRNELNNKKIKQCMIRPLKNGKTDPVEFSDLELIAISMSVNTNKKKLKVEVNKEVYVKK